MKIIIFVSTCEIISHKNKGFRIICHINFRSSYRVASRKQGACNHFHSILLSNSEYSTEVKEVMKNHKSTFKTSATDFGNLLHSPLSRRRYRPFLCEYFTPRANYLDKKFKSVLDCSIFTNSINRTHFINIDCNITIHFKEKEGHPVFS